jgi:nucleoside-diphosphate-sugar epimerase
MRLLSFGHGYSAQALADILLPLGWQIRATTRSKEKFNKIKKPGILVRIWSDQSLSDDLDWATHLLISIAPDKYEDLVLKEFREKIIKNIKQFNWVGYLSTTGVYGNHNGGWVDEEEKLIPSTLRGQYRVDAEKEWRRLFEVYKLPLHIFRLAGIYGPGRGPFSKVKSGLARRVIKKNQLFSRIHVEDIAQTLSASILKPNPGAIYNVCDDYPAPPEDVISYAANLLGLPNPPKVKFEDADMTDMARSFYLESKKVRNDKIKNELGVLLKYPNYKVGLKALIKEEV